MNSIHSNTRNFCTEHKPTATVYIWKLASFWLGVNSGLYSDKLDFMDHDVNHFLFFHLNQFHFFIFSHPKHFSYWNYQVEAPTIIILAIGHPMQLHDINMYLHLRHCSSPLLQNESFNPCLSPFPVLTLFSHSSSCPIHHECQGLFSFNNPRPSHLSCLPL